jgi:hypothetical protein
MAGKERFFFSHSVGSLEALIFMDRKSLTVVVIPLPYPHPAQQLRDEPSTQRRVLLREPKRNGAGG